MPFFINTLLLLLFTGYFLGISAATGDLSDNHDVYSIKTYDLGGINSNEDRATIIPSAKHSLHLKEQVNNAKPKMSNLKIFLFILVFLIIICFLLLILKIVLEKHQAKSRKRLY